MDHFNFWRRWIIGVGLYLAAFGLMLALFSQSALMDLAFNDNIDHYFWPAALPEAAHRFQGWIYGVLGAVVAGWGVMLAFWGWYPFQTRQPWAWNGLAAGFGLWYCVDTALSAAYGVYFNVGFNTVLLLLIAVPLMFTRKYFKAAPLPE